MKLTMDSSQYGPEMARNVGDVIDVDKVEGKRLLSGDLAHESTKTEIAVFNAKAKAAAEIAAEAKAKEEAGGSKNPRQEKTEHAIDETRETAVSQ